MREVFQSVRYLEVFCLAGVFRLSENGIGGGGGMRAFLGDIFLVVNLGLEDPKGVGRAGFLGDTLFTCTPCSLFIFCGDFFFSGDCLGTSFNGDFLGVDEKRDRDASSLGH